MRNAFADEILKIAMADSRVVLLSGDIGNRLFDKMKATLPNRFFNCGVAEANMISMAAGLAASGFRPVCYTIAPFVTSRCFEQIKIDLCYHRVPAIIVGTGSGLSYASLGATHHSFEDLALLRSLPEMHVIAPADANELRSALRWAATQSGPSYLRIGKKGEPVLTAPDVDFQPDTWTRMREGSDAILLSCGTILPEVLAAADLLIASGLRVGVWNCAGVKPLDESALASLPPGPVFTVEEHSILGGFGSAVAEFFSASGKPRAVYRLGIPDHFLHDCGEQTEARIHCGIDGASIATKVQTVLDTKW